MIEELEISLDNVIIGKKIRMFQGNGETFYSMKDSTFLDDDKRLIKENDLTYNYFMKDNDTVRLNFSYNDDFVNDLKENLNKNIGSQSYPSIFYEKNIIGLSPKSDSNIVQFGSKYYFINFNQFNLLNENLINGHYDLNPEISLNNTYNSTISVLSAIKEHIKNSYEYKKGNVNLSKDFYQDSLSDINDKSVPIYDLNEKALDYIQILKFNDASIVDSIIRKFNLTDLRDKILYSSKLNQLSSGDYDSIFIPPIVNYYLNNKEMWEYEKSEKLTEFFNFIFSNLSIGSFYRLLIPVGKISKIFNNYVTEKTDSTKLNEYTYYINVDNINSLKNNIQFNYFSLKNLRNPHNEYDYEINNIKLTENGSSITYDFYAAQQFEVLNFMNTSMNEFREFINSTHACVLSGTYIEEHNLIPEMINQAAAFYNNWTKETLEKAITTENSWIRYWAFLNYFKTIYNVDLNVNPYILTSNDLISFINEKEAQFKDKYHDKWDDELLNIYYQQGIQIFSEMRDTIFDYIEDKSKKPNDDFIMSRKVLIIKKDEYLSPTYLELLKEFKSGLFKTIAQNVLNKAEVNDTNFSSENKWYVEKYNNRFSAKINDYYNSYNDYFSHENHMKKDGILFGFRKYNFVNTSLNERLYLTYNYLTSYDQKFLNKIGLMDDVSKEHISPLEIPVYWTFENNNYNLIKNDETSLHTAKIKINESTILSLNNSSKPTNQLIIGTPKDKRIQFLSYAKTLNELSKIEFIDYIEGFNKYKETEVSKSNVYSIELINSNLNYEVYTYEEMVNLFLTKNNNYSYDYETEQFSNGNIKKDFLDAIHEINYYEILDVTLNKDINILSKTGHQIPFSSYKFYSKDNPLNVNIETKMEMRKQVEQTIRKSIHRYAPVNTTLWKIKYSGL